MQREGVQALVADGSRESVTEAFQRADGVAHDTLIFGNPSDFVSADGFGLHGLFVLGVL